MHTKQASCLPTHHHACKQLKARSLALPYSQEKALAFDTQARAWLQANTNMVTSKHKHGYKHTQTWLQANTNMLTTCTNMLTSIHMHPPEDTVPCLTPLTGGGTGIRVTDRIPFDQATFRIFALTPAITTLQLDTAAQKDSEANLTNRATGVAAALSR
jgi:hypothetical protein